MIGMEKLENWDKSREQLRYLLEPVSTRKLGPKEQEVGVVEGGSSSKEEGPGWVLPEPVPAAKIYKRSQASEEWDVGLKAVKKPRIPGLEARLRRMAKGEPEVVPWFMKEFRKEQWNWEEFGRVEAGGKMAKGSEQEAVIIEEVGSEREAVTGRERVELEAATGERAKDEREAVIVKKGIGVVVKAK